MIWLPLPVLTWAISVSFRFISHCVRFVVISQMFYWDSAISTYPVDDEFNIRVFLYNKYMFDATKSIDNIHFWSHKGVWSNWQ